MDEIGLDALIEQPALQLPAGKTSHKPQSNALLAQVLEDLGYINALAPGKALLLQNAIGYIVANLLNPEGAVQGRIKGDGIDHIWLSYRQQ